MEITQYPFYIGSLLFLSCPLKSFFFKYGLGYVNTRSMLVDTRFKFSKFYPRFYNFFFLTLYFLALFRIFLSTFGTFWHFFVVAGFSTFCHLLTFLGLFGTFFFFLRFCKFFINFYKFYFLLFVTIWHFLCTCFHIFWHLKCPYCSYLKPLQSCAYPELVPIRSLWLLWLWLLI